MATALVAADFDLKRVALDPQNNVVIGWGTFQGNDDYATATWKITPALLGLSAISVLHVTPFMKLSTATTPVLNLICLQDMGDGTYNVELYEDWAADTNDDVDAFDGVKFNIFFIGAGAVTAAS
jgi:hypothetical protein